MMSKNSFWASIRENNKRRIWVWVLVALVFMLLFPVYTAININQVMSRMEDYLNMYGAAGQGILYMEIIDTMKATLGTSVLIFGATVGTAVISAIQGFSWLYSRKKIDFYMGMPVKRKKRFLVIWLNGILLYVIPYLCGLVISMLIATGNGGMNASVVKIALGAFMLHIGLYLAVYHLALLAVMMTGNVIVTLLGFGVFCAYEYIVRMVDYAYRSLFFKYFSYYGYEEVPLLSPFSMYAGLLDNQGFGVKADAGWIAGLMAFIIVTGLLVYICYLKRPAEAAGKAMAFRMTKPVIKILIVIPAALALGIIVSDSIGFNPRENMDGIGYLIFTIVLGVVLGCCMIQVIYEFDIKGILHKKRHIVISGVITAFLFMIYRYDMLEFDSYVPQPEKVESVAFIPNGYDTINAGSSYCVFDEGEIEYLSAEEYGGSRMKLQNVTEVCELAKYSMQEYDKIDFFDDEQMNEDIGCWSNATVIYRLKNGREVYRSLWVNVDDEKTTQLLDRVIGTKEFKEGYMPGYSEALEASLDTNSKYKVEISYGNGIYSQKLGKENLKELLEMYRKDLENANFTNIKESAPIGVVSVELREQVSAYRGERTYYVGDFGMNIYPVYENCIEYLEEKGYYMESQVRKEDIMQIQVINYNSEANARIREQQLTQAGADTILSPGAEEVRVYYDYGDSEISTRVQVDYTEEADIEKIIPYIMPQDLFAYRWDNGKMQEDDYEVKVYFKSGSEVYLNYDLAYYGFMEGEVPEFVQEDTTYHE